MIPFKQFTATLADWLAMTILPNIPETAPGVRGTLRAYSEIMRARPDLVHSVIVQRAPALAALAADGTVDVEALTVMIPAYMQEAKQLDLNALLPGVTYKASGEELQSLCKMMARQGGAAQITDSAGVQLPGN